MLKQKKSEIYKLLWPVSRLGEAIEILSRKAGLQSSPVKMQVCPDIPAAEDNEALGKWIDFAARQFSIETEAVESSYAETKQMIRMACPALIRVPGYSPPRFALLLKSGRWKISLIAPDLSVRRVPLKQLGDVLTFELESPLQESINEMLIQADIPRHRMEQAGKSILHEHLRSERISGCWMLSLPPDTNFWKQVIHAGLHRYIISVFGLHCLVMLLMLLNWWLIGRSAFQGHFEPAWITAWILILFTGIPLQLMKSWIETLLSIRGGALFKQRLLYGSMQLKPEEIRHQGAGQFLSRVMESESLDFTALESAFMAVIAVTDIITASMILIIGAGGWPHAFTLFAWLLLTFLISWRYYKQSKKWISLYREMINELVERMVGQRTRLAQEDHMHWHDEEDQILDRYLNLSEQMDKTAVHLKSVIPRGWMIIGVGAIAWMFITSQASPGRLAVSLGGILIACKALTSFINGVVSITNAKLAWEQAEPLFKAASRSEDIPLYSKEFSDKPDTHQPVLLLRDVVFRYEGNARPVVKESNLKIYHGERLLLEGPSGGGKSTLAALVAGLRIPESGLMLLNGIDLQTIGSREWRKKVVAAPQFHENHILTETFAFNLLMGRKWPPSAEDIEEAEEVCRELGLGELLDRMPAGLQQMVGESGWQLSHGERSRLFIARALLQKALVIVLDESFAALDPENLHLALKCVLRRAPTLLVIAHP